MIRAIAVALILFLPLPVLAHHGGGTFDNTRTIRADRQVDASGPHQAGGNRPAAIRVA
jgi:hypothetical protein